MIGSRALLGPLEIAVDRLAADVFGGKVRPVAILTETRAERAAEPGPRFVIADHLLVEILEQFGSQGDAPPAVGQRVVGQVVGVDLRIIVHEVVVGPEGEVGVGRLRGNLLELGGLIAFDRLVGIFDGPVIVGADRGRSVVALLLSLGGDIDRVVVHHAAGHSLDPGDRGVVNLVGPQHDAGLEIMPQSQRVADLVHHHFLDRLAKELLGKLGFLVLLILVLVLLFILVGVGRHSQGERGESHFAGLGGRVVAGGEAALAHAAEEVSLDRIPAVGNDVESHRSRPA